MSSSEPGDGPAAGQIGCVTTSVLVRRLRALHGSVGVHRTLALAGVPYDLDHLENPANWIWYDDAVALLCAAAEVSGDALIARRIGEDTVRQHAGTGVATAMRALGSPEAIFEAVAVTATKFSTVADLTPLDVRPGRAVISRRTHAASGHRHFCELTLGLLSTPPVLFGLPAASVEETACQLRGDDACVFEIEWDAERAAAGADPAQLATALEAQLAAMGERLESMYATARDLVALSDVDTALHRVLERAASEIRASRHLLVARGGEGRESRVYALGYAPGEAEALAARLSGPAAGLDMPDSIAADVRSPERHHGWFVATAREGRFLPHERDLLEVYASYAAAILGTAAAVDEARLQHERAHALLGLSQALARTTSSDGVAEQVAAATPSVVDCDRVTVLLWNDAEQALTVRAVNDPEPERRAALIGHVVRADDTPHVAGQRAAPSPEPSFYRRGSDDPFVERTMEALGISGLAVVPIVGVGRFHGVLNVSVVARPDRLRPTDDLLDRLAGIAAQAATALDNARLIERMAHQAAHDNLTGLLGHRAFHEALAAAVEAGETFTLAALDLDDFKRINDTCGHPVGDAALRLVADALSASVRDVDTVFRVGGEEFALVLPGVAALDAVPIAERVRAAVAAVEFELPLSVSIGLAGFPDDAESRSGLIERADVALYAAKRAGKDRTSVV